MPRYALLIIMLLISLTAWALDEGAGSPPASAPTTQPITGGAPPSKAGLPTDVTGNPPNPPATGRRCCAVCMKGKACGDACIEATKTCSKPPGCACNG